MLRFLISLSLFIDEIVNMPPPRLRGRRHAGRRFQVSLPPLLQMRWPSGRRHVMFGVFPDVRRLHFDIAG